MGSSNGGHTLHILFFPMTATSHILPMVDMAALFSAHGTKTTLLTTPGNAALIQPSLNVGHPVELSFVPFPRVDGLPEGCENLSSAGEGWLPRFFFAMRSLREPFLDELRRLSPDCVVSDVFLPWTAEAAAELGVPTLLFHNSSFFLQCALHSNERNRPLESLPQGEEFFAVAGIPHTIKMHRSIVLDPKCLPPPIAEMLGEMKESEAKAYGAVLNTFSELEPDYAEHHRSSAGRKAWCVGPLTTLHEPTPESDSCLQWLDGKLPGSVIYICFGSIGGVGAAQLREIALALAASRHSFVWVVKGGGDEWMPERFEERVGGRGMMIRGWAPQTRILRHSAVGGFLTHCGWNSTLEGISAGVVFVTWPLFADQFYNERMIVDALRVGVEVGVREGKRAVEAAKVGRAVDELMGGGEEAEGRRRRAADYGEMARRAAERGGSSYDDIESLTAELKERTVCRQ